MNHPSPQKSYIIRRGEERDIMPYLRACQRSAAQAYARPMSKPDEDLFGPNHYFHPSIMPYWESMTINNENTHWWIAEIQAPEPLVVGGIGLKIHPGFSEGYGYYVSPEWQGRGIGEALWRLRQQHVRGPLYFEVYSHAAKTIAMHERKGAAKTGKQRLIHWDSWPSGTNLVALEYSS